MKSTILLRGILTFLVFVIFNQFSLANPVPAVDVTLTTQTEVTSFNKTAVSGFLRIRTASGTSDPITDLSPLNVLTAVDGSLMIQQNPNLTNLNGLENLQTIGDDVFIENNPLLEDIDGLSGLVSVVGELEIYNNAVLTNIDGLSSLTTISSSYLYIELNPLLTNLDGLSSLTYVDGDIDIDNNTSLTDFCGLYNIFIINGMGGNFDPTGNAQNPTVQDVLDDCNPQSVPLSNWAIIIAIASIFLFSIVLYKR